MSSLGHEKPPAFQFYPKDFLSDERCRLMTMTERGVYITLLSLCWLEESLPADPVILARLVGMSEKSFAKLWAYPLSECFYLNEEGRLSHKRLERERLKQQEFADLQQKRGKAGADARWRKHSLSIASGNGASKVQAMPKNGSSSSSSTPVVQSKEHSVVRPKPPDPRVKEFLDWFQGEYKTMRNGAEYLVKWAKHGALVKQMLGAASLDNLKIYAKIMLSDKCDDPFICESGRGIEVMYAKFDWLSDRFAQWKNKQGQAS